ncbi:MAG: GNAT family N-acetyltransferase [Candidatus Merdivicinus sp.]|jgi:predicted acetyltransferase
MITRILEPNEIWRGRQIASVCFEFPFNTEEEQQKALAMTPEEIAEAKKPPQHTGETIPSDDFVPSTFWGTFSDDASTLMGGFSVNHYTVNFDGNLVLMGGIGGVCTLPPYRRGGVIRHTFAHALPDLYEKGFIFSCLYPFSRAYYRQFGYENGAYVRELTISLSAFQTKPVGGRIEQLLPGDDLSPLTEIYQKFYKKYNLSVYRREFDPSLSKENLLEQKRYIYLWRNDTGEPRGFVIAQKTGDRIFNCETQFRMKNAFLALDSEAYQALFHFIRTTFPANYDAVKLLVPDNVRIDSLVAEGNKLGIHLDYNGMVRIVHLEKALELCKCRGTGSLKIAVTDPQIPQNTGTWRIDFDQGQPNRVSRTEEEPDISMPVSAFAPLICGIRTPDEFSMMPELTIHHPEAPFESVFYSKPCHMLELF